MGRAKKTGEAKHWKKKDEAKTSAKAPSGGGDGPVTGAPALSKSQRKKAAKRAAKAAKEAATAAGGVPRGGSATSSSGGAVSSVEARVGGGGAASSASSALRSKLFAKLAGGRFRQLNEELYTSTGEANFARFSADPELADAYHRGFREQTKSWPENPLDCIIRDVLRLPGKLVVADLGCGDARLAAEVGPTHDVKSFDLVSTAENVVACNIASVPLGSGSVDVAVFCLALMGPSHWDFVAEAHRLLKVGGALKIAEVKSRFDDATGGVPTFVKGVQALGFDLVSTQDHNKMFVRFTFKKSHRKPDLDKLKKLKFAFRPCIYKRR